MDRAIAFAETHRDQPFYIQLWPNDVHDPFKPSEAQLRAVADLNLEGFTNEDQWRKFFAVLKELDDQIGRMVDALDRLGLREETILVVTGVDLLPTLVDLAGASLPDGYRSHGVNLSGAFLGARTTRRGRPIFWEYNSLGGNIVPGLQKDRSPDLAMRDGSWKVLLNADGSGLELYDLRSDRDESRDLAEQHPRRARRMSERLLRWYHRGLPSPAGGVSRPEVEVDSFGVSAP